MAKDGAASYTKPFKTIGSLTQKLYRQALHAAQVAAPPARYRQTDNSLRWSGGMGRRRTHRIPRDFPNRRGLARRSATSRVTAQRRRRKKVDFFTGGNRDNRVNLLLPFPLLSSLEKVACVLASWRDDKILHKLRKLLSIVVRSSQSRPTMDNTGASLEGVKLTRCPKSSMERGAKSCIVESNRSALHQIRGDYFSCAWPAFSTDRQNMQFVMRI